MSAASGAAGRRHHPFLPLLGLLVLAAWVTLWLWEASPYGRYLDHGDWTRIGVAGGLCRALPGGEVALPALLYVGGWMLMTTAMMLPTAMPLLELFRRLTARRRDRRRLMALLVAGYLGVWALFGLAAHLLDAALHVAAADSLWMVANGWTIGAGVLALAGLFQFSALKYRCLDACRSPLSFVLGHWRGQAEARQAFLLGVHHGAFCVGCCWALMLLGFVLGLGSVGWMLAIGAVMAMEKNLPWGRHLAAPLGIALLLAAAAVAAANLGLAPMA